MKCFLDMDGVLTDFTTAVHEFHNIPYLPDKYPYPLGEWNWPSLAGNLTAQEFWGGLDGDFWASLSWSHDGK